MNDSLIDSHNQNNDLTRVPALEKTFQILDLITASNQPLTSAQIAKQLKLARSSTHNILQSLLQKGVLYKDSNHQFYLGSYLLYWAGKFEQQQGIIQLFYDMIAQQPLLLPHTVTLSTLDYSKGEVVFLACHESPLPLGFTFRTGVRVPAVFSATGKAMLSTLEMQNIYAMYPQGFPAPLTAYGVKNFEQLAIELQHIQKTRISLDNGQLREGMYCIGTYIRDASEKAIAGMAVSFLKTEYQKKQQEVALALTELASQMEKCLGLSNTSTIK